MDPFWIGFIATLIGLTVGVFLERRRHVREIRGIHEAYRVRIKGIHAEWEKRVREMMADALRMTAAFQGFSPLWRNGSHFYVGEGKLKSSQHSGWPPNVGDIRDDPRRKM